ncbi:MAG: UbiA family prenyltransferase [Myxococcales bacterium]|nr:UbiA family prenyltransferase [Myxococcales bacterium]MCB9751826.1 UbiA family prenyltransferase [Myxococcales bacterium]
MAAFKILRDVLVERLRKREMANLAGAVSIMLVLGLPGPEMGVRVLFATLLNVLVYLNNDYCDVEFDLYAPGKDWQKARFLRANMGAAVAAQVALVMALTVLATWWDPGLFIALIVGGGICWAYSARLKHMPGVDVAAMIIWGVTMPLTGVPIERVLGWWLVLQLGLFSGVFESIQVLRDRVEDRTLGVQTTAVALGQRRTLALIRALALLAAGFMIATLDIWAGLLVASAAVLPCRRGQVPQYWDRVRVIFGVAWLVACARIYLAGASDGLLVSIPVTAGIPAWIS